MVFGWLLGDFDLLLTARFGFAEVVLTFLPEDFADPFAAAGDFEVDLALLLAVTRLLVAFGDDFELGEVFAFELPVAFAPLALDVRRVGRLLELAPVVFELAFAVAERLLGLTELVGFTFEFLPEGLALAPVRPAPDDLRVVFLLALTKADTKSSLRILDAEPMPSSFARTSNSAFVCVLSWEAVVTADSTWHKCSAGSARSRGR